MFLYHVRPTDQWTKIPTEKQRWGKRNCLVCSVAAYRNRCYILTLKRNISEIILKLLQGSFKVFTAVTHVLLLTAVLCGHYRMTLYCSFVAQQQCKHVRVLRYEKNALVHDVISCRCPYTQRKFRNLVKTQLKLLFKNYFRQIK